MRLRWTLQAREDLLDIGRYIARDKPGAARQWVDRLRQRARDAADMPWMGRKVPEIGREDVREVMMGGYRLVYRVRDNAIEMLTVFDGHRLLPVSLDDVDP